MGLFPMNVGGGGTAFIDFSHPLWVQDNITGNTKTYTHTDTSVTEAILFITTKQNSTMTFTNCTYEQIVLDHMYGYGTMWAYHLSNMNSLTTISGYVSSGANRYFLYPCSGIDFR